MHFFFSSLSAKKQHSHNLNGVGFVAEKFLKKLDIVSIDANVKMTNTQDTLEK